MKCTYCKQDFIPAKYHPKKKYCSDKCNKTYYKLTHKREKALADKLYRENNLEKCKAKEKLWQQTHKQQKYETDKKWRISHTEQHNKNNKLWRKRHPEKNRLVQYNNYHTCKKNNPQFKLARNLRARTRQALQGKFKFDSTEKLIGCSFSKCWKHLENQFQSNMTKENYGNIWVIDHIMPCCSFDLSKKEEQFKCFNYKNLQPLFTEENQKKGSIIPKDL